MTIPPTFATHLRDAAFHARNAARSLDAAVGVAPSEESYGEAVELLAVVEQMRAALAAQDETGGAEWS